PNIADYAAAIALFGRALKDIAISDQPPKTILIPMRTPRAHSAVPGKPAKSKAAKIISINPLANIQPQPRDSRLRWVTAYIIDAAPSMKRNAISTTVKDTAPPTGDARRRAPVTIARTA